MKLKLSHIVFRSLIYNRIQFLYQVLIVLFLSAVITASLLTGYSVRSSLLTKNETRLNGTSIVVSSGNRYMPDSITVRLQSELNERCEGIIEFKGWVRNFETGKSALNTQIFGVHNSFFEFNGINEGVNLEPGEVIINQKLAQKLELDKGDDIIIRIGTPTDIPPDSPFAPENDPFESFVLSIKDIIIDNEAEFSLGINQVKPLNIFLSIDEFKTLFDGETRINRILIRENASLDIDSVNLHLEKIYTPGDAGLEIKSRNNGEFSEIISDRIFITENEISEVSEVINSARPLITYLANRLTLDDRSTPYSFVSAIHQDIINDIPGDDGIIINRWLANDLLARTGDTIKLDYFIMGRYNELVERSHSFVVERIFETESKLSDSYLMPEFPGISGSESCSRWDAGVPINLDDIRTKDEDYWNEYSGTPKAIINYKTGRKLWGNDFGPATAIRFTEKLKKEDILNSLTGKIDPFRTGLRTIPVRANTIEAAENSVDFSTLFLSLGFFVILSSIILLVLVISTHFETRHDQIRIFRSLGFSNTRIRKIFFLEGAVIALIGAISGVIAGTMLDNLIIHALNSVWKGAVQTDTLSSYTSISTLATGFLASIVIIMSTITILLTRELKKVSLNKIRMSDGFFTRRIKPILILSALLSVLMITISVLNNSRSTMLWFISGGVLFVFMIVFARYLLKVLSLKQKTRPHYKLNSSWSYFGKYPSRALSPLIFIAAGLFIIIVTGANRKSFDTFNTNRQGGTGGYIYWGETATPLLYDLNESRGKSEYDLDDKELEGIHFVQVKRVDGDDASCLNLNQVDSPPILGLDASYFTRTGSFSFASSLKETDNPWETLSLSPEGGTIYGVVDETVLKWSLFKKTGDTLVVVSENGENINIIIAGGLNSSIFQGNIIIGQDNFTRYFPSISGSDIFLVDGSTEDNNLAGDIISESLSAFGLDLQFTNDRLRSFYEVTNTYLNVFLVLGGIGLIMGVLGMGFVILRNLNLRKKEYALMLAAGYTSGKIRSAIVSEYMVILLAGILAGTLPALIATLPSLLSEASIPYALILSIVFLVLITGSIMIILSVRKLVNNKLIESLRKE